MKKIALIIFSAFLVSSCYNNKKVQDNTQNTVNNGIDRSVMPKPGPAPTVKLGKPETFTLANGLKVLVVENHKLPRVSMFLSMDNPPVAEGSKKGVSSLLSAMIGNGTSKMSKEEYNEELDFYGASVSINSGGAYASSLTRYFPQVMKLTAEGALDPLFTKEEFQKEKDKMLESLKSNEKSVTAVASNVRDALTYGINHPFGEFTTEKTVNNITYQDVVNYYKKYYSPQNAYLTIVGDISVTDAKKLAEENFSNWKKVQINRVEYPTPTNVNQTQIDFVDMPNAVQSELAVVNITHLKMTDDDYFAAVLANQILGGGGEGRLFNNLREAHGWTYGAYSSIGADKEVNSFSARTSVRNMVTDSAVVELFNELKRIRTTPVDAQELEAAKAKYIGHFVMSAQKPETIAKQALQMETQGLPSDFYENYIKRINAVTPEEVEAVAKKYFSVDNSRIVVVGKGEDVLPGLERLGYTIDFYNKDGEKVENPLKNQTQVPTGLTANKVVDNYLKAIGGKGKAKALKSVKMNFEMTGAAPQALQGELIFMAPNLEKQVINMNGNPIMTTVFDGNTLKMSGMMGNSEKSGDEVVDKKVKKGIISQAFYTADQIELTGVTKVDGKDAYKVQVKQGDDVTTEYYDANTGLLLQSSVTMETPQGDMEVVTLYKDYKKVDGIMFPFTIIQEAGPQKMVNTIKSIEVNKGVSKADFK
ncbi:insulinase family protein [Weeksellaceae bacterium TAE3-ERU29]|nr:insulinase family protein [Weeksellaceae bacterium TAE3-ERU29]